MMVDLEIDVPQLVLAALTIALLGAFLMAGVTSGASFNSFNSDWDGTSELRSTAEAEGADPVIARNVSRYDEYGERDIAFVLSPDRNYSEAEALRIGGFVDRGGTLVVATRDSQAGDTLLDAVGAEARPYGTLLRDERRYHRSPALPIADNVSDHPLVAGVESVTLNHGTAIEANNATVLVASSSTAYLDLDGNGSVSPNETLAAYPVVSVESIGSGQVIVVSDPSIFINVMQKQTSNDRFTAALINGSDNAIVDVSHSSSPPPLVAAMLAVRDSVSLQLGVGFAVLTAIGLASTVVGRRSREEEAQTEMDVDDLVTGLQQHYSDIDAETVQRVTKGVLSDRYESTDDD